MSQFDEDQARRGRNRRIPPELWKQAQEYLKPDIVGDMMADFKRSDEAVEWLSGYSLDNHAEDRHFKGCGFTLNEVMELDMNLFGRYSRG